MQRKSDDVWKDVLRSMNELHRKDRYKKNSKPRAWRDVMLESRRPVEGVSWKQSPVKREVRQTQWTQQKLKKVREALVQSCISADDIATQLFHVLLCGLTKKYSGFIQDSQISNDNERDLWHTSATRVFHYIDIVSDFVSLLNVTSFASVDPWCMESESIIILLPTEEEMTRDDNFFEETKDEYLQNVDMDVTEETDLT